MFTLLSKKINKNLTDIMKAVLKDQLSWCQEEIIYHMERKMNDKDREKIKRTIAWGSFNLEHLHLNVKLKIVNLLVNERKNWERLEKHRLEKEKEKWEKEFHDRTFHFEWTCHHCNQVCTFGGVSLTKGGDLIIPETHCYRLTAITKPGCGHSVYTSRGETFIQLKAAFNIQAENPEKAKAEIKLLMNNRYPEIPEEEWAIIDDD
jgi:hypothetical protein